MTKAPQVTRCPPHDAVIYALKEGGHFQLCIRCGRVLLKPTNFCLSPKEIKALAAFARHLRKHKKGKKE